LIELDDIKFKKPRKKHRQHKHVSGRLLCTVVYIKINKMMSKQIKSSMLRKLVTPLERHSEHAYHIQTTARWTTTMILKKQVSRFSISTVVGIGTHSH
jgi:hypothetical protein